MRTLIRLCVAGLLLASGLMMGLSPAGAARKSSPPPDLGEADLSVQVYPYDRTTDIGHDAAFSITVANAGPLTATGVTLTYSISGPATEVWLSSYWDEITCDTPGPCTVRDLQAGGNAVAWLRVTATGHGPITITAQASAAQRDPDPSDNSHAWTIESVPSADLSMNSDATTTSTGTLIGVTHTLRNEGPLDATGTTVMVYVDPAGTVQPSQGRCDPYWPSLPTAVVSDSWRCALGDLAAGEVATIDVRPGPVDYSVFGTASVYAGGGYSSAGATADQPDPDRSNNGAFTDVNGTGTGVTTCPFLGRTILCPWV